MNNFSSILHILRKITNNFWFALNEVLLRSSLLKGKVRGKSKSQLISQRKTVVTKDYFSKDETFLKLNH